MEPTEPEDQHATTDDDGLGWFILHHLGTILERWETEARHLPVARELPEPVLLDSAPAFFVSLAKAIQGGGVAREEQVRQLIHRHAIQRLEHGYSLEQAVAEYALMRDIVLEEWARRHRVGPPVDEVRTFHQTIDRAIGTAIASFTESQQRAFSALDRIAEASLESRDLEELLRRLMHAVLESLPAVNTVAILLREGDVLRVRVAEGLGRELEIGFSVPVGEGFAGTIAERREPILLQEPSEGPLLRSPYLRAQQVRALYGVPLIADDRVIGVAHIGSLTASSFQDQDIRILDSVAARATAAIYQQMLREEADRIASELLAVIESIPDAVFIANTGGIELVNRVAKEMIGLDGDEILERHEERIKRLHVRDLTTGEPLFESAFADAFRGNSTVREVIIRRLDVEERILRYSTAPVKRGGKIDLAVAIATDVTERKRFEQERADLLARERKARLDAESAVRTRDQVLAVVSHDLGNPLSAVRMSAELILRRAHEWEERRIIRHAETIRRSTSRMMHLITDLVEMAAIDTGRFQVDPKPVDLQKFVAEVVQSQEPLALEKNVRIVVETSATDERVCIDRNRMLQVFSNLLGNAFKYSSTGDTVTLRVFLESDRVQFEVSDQGPGIPQEEIGYVFEPYWTKERKGQAGTGIGLFIAKGIVDAHGGTIRVESEPDRGTTFFVSLPTGLSCEEAAAGPAPASPEAGGSNP